MSTATDLSGQTVLLTRPKSKFTQIDKFEQLLMAEGAKVILNPAIELRPLIEHSSDLVQLKNIYKYSCLVFCSATGVRFFGELIGSLGISVDNIDAGAKVAAIGAGTAEVLREIGFSVDLVPESSNSQAFADELLKNIAGPYLLVRGSRGSDVLATSLKKFAQPFDELLVYESVDVAAPSSEAVDLIQQKNVGWVTLTSPAIAASTIRMFGDLLRHAKLVSISPEVSAVVVENGFEVIAEAKVPSFSAMIQAMVEAE